MQRDAAFAVSLASRDFRAAQAAGNLDLDSLGAEAHRAADRLLHRTAERNAALQLLRDILGDERRVEVGLANLGDVDIDVLLRLALEAVLDLLDARAAAADDHARLRRVDRELQAVLRALRLDLRDAGSAEAVFQILADLDIFMQVVRKVLICVPFCIPILDDADADAVRIYFLTQTFSLLLIFLPRRRSHGTCASKS